MMMSQSPTFPDQERNTELHMTTQFGFGTDGTQSTSLAADAAASAASSYHDMAGQQNYNSSSSASASFAAAGPPPGTMPVPPPPPQQQPHGHAAWPPETEHRLMSSVHHMAPFMHASLDSHHAGQDQGFPQSTYYQTHASSHPQQLQQQPPSPQQQPQPQPQDAATMRAVEDVQQKLLTLQRLEQQQQEQQRQEQQRQQQFIFQIRTQPSQPLQAHQQASRQPPQQYSAHPSMPAHALRLSASANAAPSQLYALSSSPFGAGPGASAIPMSSLDTDPLGSLFPRGPQTFYSPHSPLRARAVLDLSFPSSIALAAAAEPLASNSYDDPLLPPAERASFAQQARAHGVTQAWASHPPPHPPPQHTSSQALWNLPKLSPALLLQSSTTATSVVDPSAGRVSDYLRPLALPEALSSRPGPSASFSLPPTSAAEAAATVAASHAHARPPGLSVPSQPQFAEPTPRHSPSSTSSGGRASASPRKRPRPHEPVVGSAVSIGSTISTPASSAAAAVISSSHGLGEEKNPNGLKLWIRRHDKPALAKAEIQSNVDFDYSQHSPCPDEIDTSKFNTKPKPPIVPYGRSRGMPAILQLGGRTLDGMTCKLEVITRFFDPIWDKYRKGAGWDARDWHHHRPPWLVVIVPPPYSNQMEEHRLEVGFLHQDMSPPRLEPDDDPRKEPARTSAPSPRPLPLTRGSSGQTAQRASAGSGSPTTRPSPVGVSTASHSGSGSAEPSSSPPMPAHAAPAVLRDRSYFHVIPEKGRIQLFIRAEKHGALVHQDIRRPRTHSALVCMRFRLCAADNSISISSSTTSSNTGSGGASDMTGVAYFQLYSKKNKLDKQSSAAGSPDASDRDEGATDSASSAPVTPQQGPRRVKRQRVTATTTRSSSLRGQGQPHSGEEAFGPAAGAGAGAGATTTAASFAPTYSFFPSPLHSSHSSSGASPYPQTDAAGHGR